MAPNLNVLTLDTSLRHCCVNLRTADQPSKNHTRMLTLTKGHAEHLPPMVEEVVSHLARGYYDLGRVVVTIGPGSYTGIRVGIAAARALGLAIGIPVVGVSTLSALLAPLLSELDEQTIAIAAINARHNGVYLQSLSLNQHDSLGPCYCSVEEACTLIKNQKALITGSGAELLCHEACRQKMDAHLVSLEDPDVQWVTSLGTLADPKLSPPTPLYVRAPFTIPQDHYHIPRV